MLLANSNENNNGCFDSSECTTSANRPYVVMTYDDNTSTPPESGNGSFVTATAMTPGTNYQVNITSAGGKKYFKFTPSVTGFYDFESYSDEGVDPKCWLYNCSEDQLTYNDDDDYYEDTYDFRITYYLVQNVTYYFEAGCFGNTTGNYSVKLKKTNNRNYIDAMSINHGRNYTVSTTMGYESKVFVFNPYKSKEYLFFTSDCISGNPKLWIYDNNLNLVVCNDGIASNINAWIEKILELNKAYYIVAGHCNNKFGQYELNTFEAVDNNTYYIKNKGSHLCIFNNSNIADEWAIQDEFCQAINAQWKIEKQSDGCYTIFEEVDNKYLGIGSTVAGSGCGKLYDNVSSYTKWKIYINKFYETVIIPASAPGKMLSAINDETLSGFCITYVNSGMYSKWDMAECSAYAYNKKHLSGLNFNIEITGDFPNDSEWVRYARESLPIWNSSAANTHITEGNSGIKFEVADREDNNYYGWTQVYNDNSAVMIIYKKKIESFSEVKRLGVYVHEIGHLFALADNPPTEELNDSLMNHFRNRDLIYQPQPYDIHNINFIYN